jgi:hypothetical protein
MNTLYYKVIIGEVGKTSTYYEVVEHNGKKFRIVVKATNGDFVGFNHDCALSVMTSNGDWANVVDNRSIGIKFDKDAVYYGRGSEADKKRVLEKPAAEFKDYIKKVY